MKNRLNKISLLSLIIFCLLIGNSVLGAEEIPKIENPLGTLKLTDIYQRLIWGSLTFIGIAAFLFFIYGGVIWLTSAGNPEKIKTGKNTIVWAVIGLAFVFLSYAILRFILQIVIGAAVK